MSDVCDYPTTRKVQPYQRRTRVDGNVVYTNEIALALRKDYRILEIYEVWYFDETSTTLFKGYVKDFMQIKMENSAPPKENLEDFKKKVKDHLGISLGEVKEDKGMRAVAKLCLNLLWGKFGQRINQTQIEYVTELKIMFVNYLHLLSFNSKNLFSLHLPYPHCSCFMP